MRDEEIHAGDVLRVRQWEDMEKEFSLNENGNIVPNIECMGEDGSLRWSHEVFTSKMRGLCGSTFTVSKIQKYASFINDYIAEEPEFGAWIFEAWMFEEIESEDEIEPGEPDTLFGFLLS